MIELPAVEYQALLERIAGELAARMAPAPAPLQPSAAGLAGCIESTLLRPGATAAEVEALCAEARRYGFAGVCVAPVWTGLAAARLRDSDVRVVTVVGFPLGANAPAVKLYEAAECLKVGADELDMVIQLGAAMAEAWTLVTDEVGAVCELAHAAGARVKTILEVAVLGPGRAAAAARCCTAAGADFLKTGTGAAAVSPEDVRRLHAVVAEQGIGIKAAGGIRTRAQAEALIAAGATRIGSSTAAALVAGERSAPPGA